MILGRTYRTLARESRRACDSSKEVKGQDGQNQALTRRSQAVTNRRQVAPGQFVQMFGETVTKLFGCNPTRASKSQVLQAQRQMTKTPVGQNFGSTTLSPEMQSPSMTI